jgi:GNAT superfamily N-acetyltransferase
VTTELEQIETYYDAAPRSAARTEEHGPFTLFVGTGPWPYYARPRLGGDGSFTAEAVAEVRERMRALGQPEALEWVHELAPALLGAVRATGLDVLEAPLMVLRMPRVVDMSGVRILDADDPAVGPARAVADIGFRAEGTAVGPDGPAERDAAVKPAGLAFLRDRLRRRITVMAAAETEDGPVAVGYHQPVGEVTEVVGVATLPALRRRGLGAAVTGALVADALEHGARIVFLSAGSDEIARVYGRLGFARIATACIAG